MSYTPVEWKNDSTTPLSAENLNHMEDGIANAVCRDGDTMTGSLILKGSPTQMNEAATKKYVEDYVDEYITKQKDHTWRDYRTGGILDYQKDQSSITSATVDGEFTYLIVWSITVDSDTTYYPHKTMSNKFVTTNPSGYDNGGWGGILKLVDGDDYVHIYCCEGVSSTNVYRLSVKRSGNKLYMYGQSETSLRKSVEHVNFSVI